MYDLIIIGGGPAGLTAGIYAGRYKLNALVIAGILGGTALEAHMIENWPGFMFVKGPDLMHTMVDQVKNTGVEVKEVEATKLVKKDDFFEVYAGDSKFEAKKLILALGTKRRKLNLPNEDKYLGKGISYCVHCDGPMFKDKVVAVVGGANSAVMAALLLAEYANKVYLVYRREHLRCDPMYCERAEKNEKIEIIYNANVSEIQGKDFLKTVKLDNGAELKIDGFFVEIGGIPSISLANDIGIILDENNYIVVDGEQKTNIDGVFAAGDITNANANLKQITTAVGEGAVAAFSAYKSLKK
ncbi:FAD-dependent oxidoreductase [Candidatus Woesearchaeota archaeon]|nr:FAD-dependent oxidoreductase [Candidatus Woesearchaeota archaeon]